MRILIFLLICGSCLCFREQSVAVRGQLRCGTQPAVNIRAQLVDKDAGPDPDDSIEMKFTDKYGNYSLSGSVSELSEIDPELRIYHVCNHKAKPCQRLWVIRVPSKYIKEGTESDIPMDLGIMNLEVKGRFMCGANAANEVQVKLVDDDFGPDEDDNLDAGYTDADGRFELSGSTTEMTTIDAHLKIYHDCNDGMNPCQRRWNFELPSKYISGGVFDIGTWNLEALLPGESRDCQH